MFSTVFGDIQIKVILTTGSIGKHLTLWIPTYLSIHVVFSALYPCLPKNKVWIRAAYEKRVLDTVKFYIYRYWLFGFESHLCLFYAHVCT